MIRRIEAHRLDEFPLGMRTAPADGNVLIVDSSAFALL
jgi:hypothetical protein